MCVACAHVCHMRPVCDMRPCVWHAPMCVLCVEYIDRHIPRAVQVCPETAVTVYTDAFFTAQDLVVNALDNIQARLFMDG